MEYSLLFTLSAFLLGIGSYCLVTRKDLIRILIGLQIAMNAVNIFLITLSNLKSPGLIDPLPHVLVIISIAVDGCVIALGLILATLIYRRYLSLDVERVRRLRW